MTNRTIAQLLVGCAAIISPVCMAATVFVKGQVEYVRTHDASAMPSWSPPKFWFTLKGVTQAVGCIKWVNGSVLLVGNDRQQLALIIAAQTSGQEVAVALDDTQLLNNLCVATYLTTGNPAPLF